MSEKRKRLVVREMRTLIENNVAAGFESAAEIVEGAISAFSDELPADTLRPIAERLVAKAIEKHMEAQANWPATTDCDRLDAAFTELEGQYGILARQNYSDCLTGGHAEMQEEVADARAQGRKIRGYTFFHMQDTDFVLETGFLGLAFGTVAGHREEVALAILPKFLENEDTPIPADREQPVRFKQKVIQTWQEANPAVVVPATFAEAFRVVQSMVKDMPMLERLGVMSAVPESELAVFRVANEIVDTLRRHDLDATWEGRSERRIEVRVDWKRRR